MRGLNNMALSGPLSGMLRQELSLGNVVEGEYENEFANCRILVILRHPFKAVHLAPDNVEEFTNRDSHFPVGVGYKDNVNAEILIAPLA